MELSCSTIKEYNGISFPFSRYPGCHLNGGNITCGQCFIRFFIVKAKGRGGKKMKAIIAESKDSKKEVTYIGPNGEMLTEKDGWLEPAKLLGEEKGK